MEVSSAAGTRIADTARSGNPAPAKLSESALQTAETSQSTPQEPLRVSAEVIAELADRARSVLRPVNLDITFSVDKDSGNTIIRIMDMETNTVIRQIPSEEMMALTRALDKMQGALLKNTV